MLTESEITDILRDFPKFELSYENIAHKKVYNANVVIAIPEGKKCFAWFTGYKTDNVCFIMELNGHNKITNVSIVVTSFSDKLALGTIFYGTLFLYNKINCFTIEDIYFYKGKSYIDANYSTKLCLLDDIFKNEISQNVFTNNFTIFGVPLMGTDFNLLLKEIELLPYNIEKIQFRFLDNQNKKKILFVKYFKPGTNSNTNSNNKPNNASHFSAKFKAIFLVTADVEPDIYNLYIYNGVTQYYDNAFIPDYKTSVMMNKLFRKIKENDNLDALEESDDEAEFEDPRDDKFVYLDRSFKMFCEYNSKFKKWVPVSLAGKKDKIITYNQLVNRK